MGHRNKDCPRGQDAGCSDCTDIAPPLDCLLVDMKFNAFARANRLRAEAWHEDGEPWSLADWGNAIGGEVGELQNEIKKIRRIQTGVLTRESESDLADLQQKAMNEVADVVIYAFLVFDELAGKYADRSLAETVIQKFNATSEKFGLPHKL